MSTQDIPIRYRSLTIDNKKVSKTFTEIEEIEKALYGTGEHFILKDDLYETVKESNWKVILTDKALLKLELDNTVRTRKEILDIHSVEIDEPMLPSIRRKLGLSTDPYDPRCFTMYSYKSALDLQNEKVKGVIGLGMNFDSFLQVRRFQCPTEASCLRWVTVLNRLIIHQYQGLLESKMIWSPEIYQHHSCAIKVNKRGIAQERVLVLSNEWIYNVEIAHNPTLFKEFKWCLPIHCLKSITLSTSQDSPSAILSFDQQKVKNIKLDKFHTGAKGSDVHEANEFLFRDSRSRLKTVREIARLFYNASKRSLRLNIIVDPNDYFEEQEVAAALNSSYTIGVHDMLKGHFKKLNNNFFQNSVTRFCKFDKDGVVEWSGDDDQSDKDKLKGSALVTSIIPYGDPEYHNRLDKTELNRFFTLNTTGKPLHLIAATIQEHEDWVEGVNTVLERLRLNDFGDVKARKVSVSVSLMNSAPTPKNAVSPTKELTTANAIESPRAFKFPPVAE